MPLGDGLSLPYYTPQDDTLEHQVRFLFHDHHVVVSCNCRKDHTANNVAFYSAIAPSHNLDDARRLYNDPANHWASFSEGDKAKW